MSIIRPHTITCPRCGRRASRDLAESINAPRAPHLRQAVLAGTLQRFTCDGCGQAHVGEVRLAYLDLPRRVYIDMFPAADVARRGACEQETARAFRRLAGDGGPPHARQLLAGVTPTTVFGLEALRDALLAHEERLS